MLCSSIQTYRVLVIVKIIIPTGVVVGRGGGGGGLVVGRLKKRGLRFHRFCFGHHTPRESVFRVRVKTALSRRPRPLSYLNECRRNTRFWPANTMGRPERPLFAFGRPVPSMLAGPARLQTCRRQFIACIAPSGPSTAAVVRFPRRNTIMYYIPARIVLSASPLRHVFSRPSSLLSCATSSSSLSRYAVARDFCLRRRTTRNNTRFTGRSRSRSSHCVFSFYLKKRNENNNNINEKKKYGSSPPPPSETIFPRPFLVCGRFFSPACCALTVVILFFANSNGSSRFLSNGVSTERTSENPTGQSWLVVFACKFTPKNPVVVRFCQGEKNNNNRTNGHQSLRT